MQAQQARIQNIQFKVQGVLSYPALFEPRANVDPKTKLPTGTPKYGASIIIPKTDTANIQIIKAAIEVILKQAFPGVKVEDAYSGLKNGSPLYDGMKKFDKAGYGKDVVFINASSFYKPVVVDQACRQLPSDTPLIYAGCIVNAQINAWYQNNNYGKNVNFELKAIQLVSAGTPFGHVQVDPTSVFGVIPGGENTGGFDPLQ